MEAHDQEGTLGLRPQDGQCAVEESKKGIEPMKTAIRNLVAGAPILVLIAVFVGSTYLAVHFGHTWFSGFVSGMVVAVAISLIHDCGKFLNEEKGKETK